MRRGARNGAAAVHAGGAKARSGGVRTGRFRPPRATCGQSLRCSFFVLKMAAIARGKSMFKTLCCAATAMLALSTVTRAAEPGATRIPQAVVAVSGCWGGRGEVMGKPVTVTIDAKPIVQNAMMALDRRRAGSLDSGRTVSEARSPLPDAGKAARMVSTSRTNIPTTPS
jgi:hypothetical protein